ncbi:transporter [Sinomicrobium weinanense]|uniref:Transporter n=1 Tax=Sinomicrobium weinanense TaxID=2842200 RepID=A0A926JTB4_9FLAO|nr:transporter [Sinomicrobium weinanense]MBC9797145.1 transporter [Sinomicrobium weinanense]MBU3124486.1 transporter [Sinomicrobium weinanense]
MKRSCMALLCVMATVTAFAQHKETETPWTSARPDGHAPISVMGDHTHHKGEWMFSYRFMYMQMKDLKNGSDNISHSDVYGNGYMVSPLKMNMKMHMLGVMHAVSDKITLMAMLNYIENDMDLQMMMNNMTSSFATSSSGFGDIKVSALYQFLNKNHQELHGLIGVSVPSGSIDKKDVTPMSSPDKIVLPYPMQMGSGTLGTDIGLTYLGQNPLISWGSQLKATFYYGENSNDYRPGNMYDWNSWLAVKTTDWLSFSARLQARITEDIHGENPDLNPMMVTTANTENSGGKYILSGLGLNTYIPGGNLKDLRLGIEFGYPVYQDVNGIQLSQKETLTVGLQYAF